MRIGSWNINSVRARKDRALDVLDRWDLDVLLLQETKCKPDQFPVSDFEAAGYQVACAGLNQWNGVAVISRVGLEDIRTSFPGQPAFAKSDDEGTLLATPVVEARALGARVGKTDTAPGIDVWSLYIPNGRAYQDPHYVYKLRFLDNLAAFAGECVQENPDVRMFLAGDWNVAPEDGDVWDINFFRDDVGMYVTPEERTALAGIQGAGFTELSRRAEGQYTYWDYQRLRFPKNEGMRIDFAYASPALAPDYRQAWIDREERKGKGASDHVPVIVDFF